MVSYKDRYLEVKKQLKELQSNCIDLRDHQDLGHPIVFDLKLWQFFYDTKNKKVLVDHKNPMVIV